MPVNEWKEQYKLREYEDSVKAYRDIVNAVNTARKEGHEEGHEKGLKEGLEKGLEEGHEKGLKEGLEKGLEEGHEKGLKEGLEKGREEEKIEIVRKMKSDGLPDDVISKYTGLPIGEIERI